MSSYITKDSGQRQEFESGMCRDSTIGKDRYDLIQPLDLPYELQPLTRWAQLMGRGAEKYSERNWEKANSLEELLRFKASAYRHFMQWYHGKEDEDHMAAVMFNLTGAEFVKYVLDKKEKGE